MAQFLLLMVKFTHLLGLTECQIVEGGKGVEEEPVGTSEAEAEDVTRQQQRELLGRKQELKLDLDVNAPPLMLHNLPTSGTPATSEDSTENSMIWQRLPMGTGDVKRKRQAFEQQIKAKSVDEKLIAHTAAAASTTASEAAAVQCM